MAAWYHRAHAAYPFQDWNLYPPEAIVQVKNSAGVSTIDLVRNLWWGYEKELGILGEGVITRARRLDKPKAKS